MIAEGLAPPYGRHVIVFIYCLFGAHIKKVKSLIHNRLMYMMFQEFQVLRDRQLAAVTDITNKEAPI